MPANFDVKLTRPTSARGPSRLLHRERDGVTAVQVATRSGAARRAALPSAHGTGRTADTKAFVIRKRARCTNNLKITEPRDIDVFSFPDSKPDLFAPKDPSSYRIWSTGTDFPSAFVLVDRRTADVFIHACQL